MKKSDELFRQALAAKAEEIEHAKSRIAKMQAHSNSNIESLKRGHTEALTAIAARRDEQINENNRLLEKINAEAEETTRECNAMFNSLIAQEEQHLADYEQFTTEVVNGFDKRRKSNSSELSPLEQKS